MKQLLLFLFLIFSSQLYAHQAHNDNFLNKLKPTLSKKAFNTIEHNMSDFTLEAHYMTKNTDLDKKLKSILVANKFNKTDYINTLKEIYKSNPYVKNVDFSKSADILATFNQKDRIAIANVLQTLNSHHN